MPPPRKTIIETTVKKDTRKAYRRNPEEDNSNVWDETKGSTNLMERQRSETKEEKVLGAEDENRVWLEKTTLKPRKAGYEIERTEEETLVEKKLR